MVKILKPPMRYLILIASILLFLVGLTLMADPSMRALGVIGLAPGGAVLLISVMLFLCYAICRAVDRVRKALVAEAYSIYQVLRRIEGAEEELREPGSTPGKRATLEAYGIRKK